MHIDNIMELLKYSLKNETDGFAASILEPGESGLPVYIIFNCYGCYRNRLLIPRKHRKMIVEIAKDNGADRRCGRFNWNEMIPVEVSDSPKIMLRGKNPKRTRALFSQQDWVVIYKYIKQNREVIQKHWVGEFDTFDLFEGLQPKPINLSERERKNEQL